MAAAAAAAKPAGQCTLIVTPNNADHELAQLIWRQLLAEDEDEEEAQAKAVAMSMERCIHHPRWQLDTGGQSRLLPAVGA